MKFPTRVCLVLLRLVIGWHFLVEGLHKFEPEKPWSSEVYLREASGPLAPEFREIAGDAVVEKLTIPQTNGRTEAERFPAALARDWDLYLQRFIQFHHLDQPDKQRARDEVESAFRQQKAMFVQWVLDHKSEVTKSSPYSADRAIYMKTIQERLDAYKAQQEEVHHIETHLLEPGYDAAGFAGQRAQQELAQAKQELGSMRDSLRADLRQQTQTMQQELQRTLERAAGDRDSAALPLPDRLPWHDWNSQARHLWFGYWALTIVAGWCLLACFFWSAWNPRSWTTGRWLRWVIVLGLSLAGAIGITCQLHQQWWHGWTMSEYDVHGLVGWLHIGAGAGLVLSLLFIVLGLARRHRRNERGPLLGWLTCTMVLASAALVFAALLLTFGQSWIGFNRLEWTDGLVTWGLVTIGACLMLGFWTRTAALLGAVLVFSFYLAMPPFPWLPPNPLAEGHYLWINKNVIEGVALLVLATTLVGRWAGVDGVLCWLNPRMWRVRKPRDNDRGTVPPKRFADIGVPIPTNTDYEVVP